MITILPPFFSTIEEGKVKLKQKDLVNYLGYAEAVVDMIFVSPELKILDKKHHQVNVSDHLPLSAVLQL